jgi:beta-galactosidase
VEQFPKNFLWGAATAAYQIEGAADRDGRGPSIWDTFCSKPGNTACGHTGAVACDHYNRYRDDVQLMRRLNLQAYRFSVSWPRVMPTGRGAINAEGLDFYDRLVDDLCANGIEPFATLYHWDLPDALQNDLGGWVNDDLPRIFADYADVVYRRIADRVRYWITINEPWCVVDGGYFHGVHAPGLRDRAAGYRAGHNLIRAHAYAAEKYRTGHAGSGGQISLALNSGYTFPATSSKEDAAAAERFLLNFAGWFGDPIFFGDYPQVMRERLGELLPAFSTEDAALLRRSMDFLAVNYYTSDTICHRDGEGPMDAAVVSENHWPRTEMNWVVRPEGLRGLLVWLHERYRGVPMYITENGAAYVDEVDGDGFVNDPKRIEYLQTHIAAAAEACAQGVDLRGFLVWSLMDNLEWSLGFTRRFGLVRCDFDTLQRSIKASGQWYAKFIANGQSAGTAS